VTFRWRMLLLVAARLLQDATPEERARRSAINRAYYAAYGEAREYSISHGLHMHARGQSHDQVWQFLRRGAGYSQRWEQAATKAIGDYGVELRTMRVQADYNLPSPPSERDAQRAVRLADHIINRILQMP
jgi:hypothetical protein